MKADLTRSTDRPDQHFRAVRLQQGRVQLDAEWNEQQEILNRRIETETRDTLGQGAAVPMDDAGFVLTGNGQNVSIGAGRCYVQGLLCDAAAGLSVITQPELSPAASPVLPMVLPPAGAAALAAIRVYDSTGAAVAPADGLYIGYVEAWLRHITALEDPLIREVALGVPDTTTRDQLVWQVKLLRAGGLADPLSCLSDEPWKSFTQAPDGSFAARAEASVPPKDPCLLAPEAGYRRLENQLYRVEIHDDASLSGKLRYKWSRDNGSIVSRVTRWLGDPVANEFEVDSLGRDAQLAITGDCWVEVFDTTHEQLGLPGTLVQVLKTEGNVVTVDLGTATGPLDKALFAVNPRVRRWESWAQMAPAAANTAGGWVELEDGVEVKFTPGRYRIGDFWTVPARTATADIEWPLDSADKPRFVAPQGVLRAFARLAVLRCAAGTWTTLADCRHLFPALSALRNLAYVGGDGQTAMPNPLAPVPVALPRPLEVAVFNGQFPVANALVRFSASHGLLPNNSLSQDVATDGHGVAAIVWRIAPATASQTCQAQLLDAGQPAAGRYTRIDFSAATAIAEQIAYDPSQCAQAKAAGLHTVQAALDALCQTSHGGGCCVTVGQQGSFLTLDQAIKALLERGERDLCLCLLPGDHVLAQGLALKAPAGTRLHVHGAGPASRLTVRQQPVALANFYSLSLADFEIRWTQDWALLRLEACARVSLRHMDLSGFTTPGQSLLQVAGSAQIELSHCRVNGYFGETLIAHLKQIFALQPLLKPLQAGFEVDSGGIFAPLDDKLVASYAALDAAQRKALDAQIATAIRASQTGELPMGPEELEAHVRLRADLAAGVGAPLLALSLEAWRTGILIREGGAALALQDARADTLLADNRLAGSLSLYGESKGPRPTLAQLKAFNALLGRGAVDLAAGPGRLRLRNNCLRGVRLGDAVVERLVQLIQDGQGVLDGGYRSLVADANTVTAQTIDLLAVDLSLGTSSFEVNADVGMAIARQGKYLGNFAHNDFRLFIAGHVAEQFGNGALNIVPV